MTAKPPKGELKRIITAYALAQNPLCRRMMLLSSNAGFGVEDLALLEPHSLRLDALNFDPVRKRFEDVVVHFVDEAMEEKFVASVDLSQIEEVQRF